VSRLLSFQATPDLIRLQIKLTDGGESDTCKISLDDSAGQLKEIDRVEGNPWVIVGAKPGTHLTDLQPFWQRVRARAGLKDARIHDLRHTFASTAIASGQGLPMIGKLLGRTQVQTAARYAHLAADPVKAAADQVSSTIAAALSAPAAAL
jgi:integrase